MMLFVPLALVSCLVLVVYLFVKQSFTFWKRHGLETYPGASFPFGHFTSPLSKDATNMGIMFNKFYKYFKDRGIKHAGVYMLTTPLYFPLDLDILKEIMVKSFDNFADKGMFFNEELQPVTAHLFQIGGQRWRKRRVKLTPTFTSGKMKMMFPAVVQCTDALLNSLEAQPAVNIKEACAKYTINVIGACAFGIECDSYKNSEFHYYGTRVFKTGTLRAIGRQVMLFYPQLATWLRIRSFPQDTVDFFMNMITETVNMREASNEKRNDFIQLLIELKNKPNKEEALTMKEVLAEGWLFFNAGFETSATTMSFCLFELAKHADIQETVRAEAEKVFQKHSEWTYEAMGELKYLQQVIDETLRLHSPVTMLNRECTKDIKIDDAIIPKGSKVYIPSYSIHMDPEYYKIPHKFDPERFTDEAKRNRHPYAYMPFGEGPRICIGMRFALMQIKIGIAQLLRRYRFTLDPCVPQELTYNQGFILSANQKLILRCHKN